MSLSSKNYRSHDYKFLIKRWRKLCKECGLKIEEILVLDHFPHFEVSSPKLGKDGIIYLSAGIHGDESASTEGLLAWAQSNLKKLQYLPLLIYPCLNPWGLENNSRVDAKGVDLNRVWSNPKNILIKHILKRTKALHFQTVINLHEDFDGQGIYLYEPSRGGRPSRIAEGIMEVASAFIPRDPRRMIDGRKATNGIIRPRPSNPPKEGIPEALHFYLKHKCPTFTFETPSEFDLELRIQAHAAMIHQIFNSLP